MGDCEARDPTPCSMTVWVVAVCADGSWYPQSASYPWGWLRLELSLPREHNIRRQMDSRVWVCVGVRVWISPRAGSSLLKTPPVAWREGGSYQGGLLETPPIPIDTTASESWRCPQHRVPWKLCRRFGHAARVEELCHAGGVTSAIRSNLRELTPGHSCYNPCLHYPSSMT